MKVFLKCQPIGSAKFDLTKGNAKNLNMLSK